MEFPSWTIRSSITTHEKVCRRSQQPEAHDFSRVYFTGSKGIGKTALLSKIADILRGRGFFVYRCVGRVGMARRFKQELVPCGSDGKIELDDAIMAKLGDGSCLGVAVIIDDMRMGCIDDFRIIASAVQKIAGAGNRVVMAVASMPNDIDAIEDDGTVSFLRRMHRLHIDAIDIEELPSSLYCRYISYII